MVHQIICCFIGQFIKTHFAAKTFKKSWDISNLFFNSTQSVYTYEQLAYKKRLDLRSLTYFVRELQILFPSYSFGLTLYHIAITTLHLYSTTHVLKM